jgi:hypothetical protein
MYKQTLINTAQSWRQAGDHGSNVLRTTTKTGNERKNSAPEITGNSLRPASADL